MARWARQALSVVSTISVVGCGGLDAPTDVDSEVPPRMEDASLGDAGDVDTSMEASGGMDGAMRLADADAASPGARADAESGVSIDSPNPRDVDSEVGIDSSSPHVDATSDARGVDATPIAPADVVTTCGPPAPAGGYTFDTSGQCWAVTYTAAQPGSAPIAPANVVLSFDAVDGQPAPGSLRADIPFAMAGQFVGIGVSLAPSSLNLTGKVVTARIEIVSGVESPADLMVFPAGAKIYVRSGASYVYAAGVFTNVTTTGNWIALQLDPARLGYVDSTVGAPFDPSDIRELGIQIDASSMTTTAQAAVILVDSVTY